MDEIVSRYVNDFFSGDKMDRLRWLLQREVAVKLINQLQGLKRKVPEDISVTGFDDSVSCGKWTCAFNQVSHPKENMGQEAAKLLLQLIKNRDNRWIPQGVCFSTGIDCVVLNGMV